MSSFIFRFICRNIASDCKFLINDPHAKKPFGQSAFLGLVSDQNRTHDLQIWFQTLKPN